MRLLCLLPMRVCVLEPAAVGCSRKLGPMRKQIGKDSSHTTLETCVKPTLQNSPLGLKARIHKEGQRTIRSTILSCFTMCIVHQASKGSFAALIWDHGSSLPSMEIAQPLWLTNQDTHFHATFHFLTLSIGVPLRSPSLSIKGGRM